MTSVRRVVDLRRFGPVIQADARRFWRLLDVETRRWLGIEFVNLAGRATPVGTLVKTSPHPGKLRASLMFSAGTPQFADLPDQPHYPVPGVETVERGLADLEAGEPAFLTYRARTGRKGKGYAAVIERGRRRVRATRGETSYTTTVGSEQARRGWVRPTLQLIGRTRLPAIFRRAAEAVGRRL